MQQGTIQLRQVQPSVLSNAERTVKNWREELSHNLVTWLATKNEWFSAFTGEKVTNKHVTLAHLYMVALTGALLLAGWLEGGAL
jgi:hypothetical protein